MMPAKLTHQLLMIGLSYLEKKGKKEKKSLIFDPFCGMGTTGFIANALGLDFV
jgi:DNA modification methylase